MTTLDYAKQEFLKYYRKVTGMDNCEIKMSVNEKYKEFDDEIHINIDKGKGIISGSNERAVLIGVYRFFYELGCRFIRPGKNGEIIIKRNPESCSVKKDYYPKTRYRAVCCEGAVSEENVIDMVEWLPKIGMNSYFMQFVDGHLFFEKWYKHKGSTVLKPEEYSVEQSRRHYKNVVEVIKRCGLIYQAVGHGWTTEPLGYVTYGDTRSKEEDILPEHRELFALIDGKRTFCKVPGDTQLCYSNPKARAVITDAIVEYLEKHKEVNVLHFWLADSLNNHCECENCSKMLPSEWYVIMLNELDEKLGAKNIDTKVVFLIYCDLLFAPQRVSLKNPDRFIMMYAPIARSFFEPLFTKENLEKATDAPAYKRNQNNHPKTPGQYLFYLKEWQKKVKCDSFSFDYHLMTFLTGGEQGGEPSGIRLSRTIFEDMKGLDIVGLNGNVSCQLQRTFTPVALPNYVMAATLFGTDKSFEEIEEEYFSASFGRQSQAIKEILHKTEKFYLTDFMRGKANLSDNIELIKRFTEEFENGAKQLSFDSENSTVDCSLKILDYFIKLQIKVLKALLIKAKGGDAGENIDGIKKFIDEREMSVQPFEDSLFRKEGLSTWL